MKIITNFKDYYDGLSSHDASTGVYERRTKEIPVDWIGYGNSCIGTDSYEIKTGIVGFCGTLYPFVKYTYTLKGKTKSGILYTYEGFKAVADILENILPTRWAWMGGKSLLKSYSGLDCAKAWFAQDFQTLLDDRPYWDRTTSTGSQADMVKPHDVFLNHKVPCFILIRDDNSNDRDLPPYRLILNPKLTDYAFGGIFDAYSCFQEIEMFMTNYLVHPDDPQIDPISDVLKAEAHGFNKFSFRKDKCKPKRRKNK